MARLLSFARERFDEPSTWAGLAALAAMFGRHDVAQLVTLAGQTLPDLVAVVASGVAIVKADKGAAK